MFGVRRARHRLSSELTFQLDREHGRGFGFQVRPFEIRCESVEGPNAVLGGSFAIFEIAAVDAGGAAEAVGVQPLDILLVLLSPSVPPSLHPPVASLPLCLCCRSVSIHLINRVGWSE